MHKLLIASTNPGKLIEIAPLLSTLSIQLCTPDDISLTISVVENAETYTGNAKLKARAWCEASGLITLADDSGLEVKALTGAPGLFSARFTGSHAASDVERRQLLLQNLKNKPHPWLARFVCSVAIAAPSGQILFGEGECSGEIILEERGNNGFGYDPLFLISALGKTMAECSIQEKNQISHRARAVNAVLPALSHLLNNLPA